MEKDENIIELSIKVKNKNSLKEVFRGRENMDFNNRDCCSCVNPGGDEEDRADDFHTNWW